MAQVTSTATLMLSASSVKVNRMINMTGLERVDRSNIQVVVCIADNDDGRLHAGGRWSWQARRS